MVDFDVSQLNRLAADLGRGNAKMVVEARKIIEVASVKIKKDMAKEIGKSPHFHQVAPAISYDIHGLDSEIGPVMGEKKAGSLAFIAAHGTSTTPPSWEYTAALQREAPFVVKFLEELAVKSVL